jgi:hypothetical protein
MEHVAQVADERVRHGDFARKFGMKTRIDGSRLSDGERTRERQFYQIRCKLSNTENK